MISSRYKKWWTLEGVGSDKVGRGSSQVCVNDLGGSCSQSKAVGDKDRMLSKQVQEEDTSIDNNKIILLISE